MNTPNPKDSADAGRRSPQRTAARTNRKRISRELVPERKSGHPLWQRMRVIAARMVAVAVTTFVLLTGIAFCENPQALPARVTAFFNHVFHNTITEALNDAALSCASYFMPRPAGDLPKPADPLPAPIPGVM